MPLASGRAFMTVSARQSGAERLLATRRWHVDAADAASSLAADSRFCLEPAWRRSQHVWSRRFGDAATQQYVEVALDPRGDVVLFGAFAGALDFGGGPLTSAGGLDLFVAKLDALGGHVWSRRAGDAKEQLAADVAFDASGRALDTGTFEGSVDLGGGALSSAGSSDVFVARFLP